MLLAACRIGAVRAYLIRVAILLTWTVTFESICRGQLALIFEAVFPKLAILAIRVNQTLDTYTALAYLCEYKILTNVKSSILAHYIGLRGLREETVRAIAISHGIL